MICQYIPSMKCRKLLVNTVSPSWDYLLLQLPFPFVPEEPSSLQFEWLQNFLWPQLPIHSLCSEGLSIHQKQYCRIQQKLT